MQSTRPHRATLLHYVSANGVEDERQATPSNAAEIARILLDAGAAVDAVLADGESTTLGLTASSVHPQRAGVQIALLELLLARGAAIDGVPGGRAPLNAALANGRPQAAEFLARRGARLDLEGAAGLGRLDAVATFFHDDGTLRGIATDVQLQAGFRWAAEYGHNDVIAYLLDRGADPAAQDVNGLTALHWAVAGGRLDTVRLLLGRNAPLKIVNAWGGTVLGTAVWSAHNIPAHDYRPILHALLDAGAAPDASPGLREAVSALLA